MAIEMELIPPPLMNIDIEFVPFVAILHLLEGKILEGVCGTLFPFFTSSTDDGIEELAHTLGFPKKRPGSQSTF